MRCNPASLCDERLVAVLSPNRSCKLEGNAEGIEVSNDGPAVPSPDARRATPLCSEPGVVCMQLVFDLGTAPPQGVGHTLFGVQRANASV